MNSKICRIFKLVTPNGETRMVTQLQTKKWDDLTAPEETKLLRDIVHKTRDLSNRNENLVNFQASDWSVVTFPVISLVESESSLRSHLHQVPVHLHLIMQWFQSLFTAVQGSVGLEPSLHSTK